MAEPASTRRKRLLGQFRRKLEGLSADEIQAMLDRRRIRSAERTAIAQEILKQRGQAKGERPAAEAAGVGPLAQMAARAAGNGAGAKADQPAGGEAAPAATEMKAGEEIVPIARKIGRVLGIGLGVASIAALAIFAIRR